MSLDERPMHAINSMLSSALIGAVKRTFSKPAQPNLPHLDRLLPRYGV